MFDHIGFRVRDHVAARRFYDAVAAPLGLQTIDNSPSSFLLGRSAQEPIPFVWIGTDEPTFWSADHRVSASPIHLAFAAPDHEAVDAFHRAALAAGGHDNGGPGPRGPEEWPDEMRYYAAFVIDPDGNNIEAGKRG
ncbi:VOC family protein [Bosea sp. (in: a-proteobacteria)]|uniref:VOC family protein n=1 Tax=Bosea sp. (in: a-proteobacteria) TaxID=1871050 RepID=UPI003F716BA7